MPGTLRDSPGPAAAVTTASGSEPGRLLRPRRIRPPPNRGGSRRTCCRRRLPDRNVTGPGPHCRLNPAYVKPHGALYSTIVDNREQAGRSRGHTPQTGFTRYSDWRVGFFTNLPDSVWTAAEAFADPLISPTAAWCHDASKVRFCARPGRDRQTVVGDGRGDQVTAVDGSSCGHRGVEPVCPWRDSPGAVDIAAAVRRNLPSPRRG